MTSKQLNSAVAKWQKRLRIQDWDIETELVSRGDIIDRIDADVLGACHCMETKKKAQILLLHPAELSPKDDSLETILVHEMLHIVMPVQDLNIKVDNNNPVYIAYERIVDQLARTLVEAYAND